MSLECKWRQSAQIGIMFISETHLTHKHNLQIYGYCFYDTKHPEGKAHGDTGILIRSRIKHYLLADYCKEYLQVTSIRLLEITIIAINCPRKFKLTSHTFVKFFSSLGNTFLSLRILMLSTLIDQRY